MEKALPRSNHSSQRFDDIYSICKQFSKSRNFNFDQVFYEAVKFEDSQCSPSEIWQELNQHFFTNTSQISSNPAINHYYVWLALGETGQGKSTFVNAICGPNAAVEGRGIQSKTENIKLHTSNEHKIIVIDTPGLFATQKVKNEEIADQIIKTVQDQLKQNAHIKAIFFIWSPTSSMRLRLDEILTILRKALGEEATESIIFVVNKVSRSWNDDHDNLNFEFHMDLKAKKMRNPIFVRDLKQMRAEDIEELKRLTERVKSFREEDFEAHRKKIYEKKFLEAQRISEDKKKEREKIQNIARIQKEAAEERPRQYARYEAHLNSSINAALYSNSYHPPSYPISDSLSSISYPQPATKIPEPLTQEERFYKGGQFIPGGGHAPKGGCYAQLAPAKPQTAQTADYSHGEGKFYKGGQFIPGGGHAPKGGIWIK